MRFILTEEQALIRDSARDWLAGHYDFRQREAGLRRDGGSPVVWRAFAQLGWLSLPLPEDEGGLGLGLVEAGLLSQALGRHLVVEPWNSTVLLAGRLLALAGTSEQRSMWLPGLAAGQHRLALAHSEPADLLPWSARSTTAARGPDGWRVTGEKRQVVAAPGAARWLVSACVEGRTQLFLVDPQASGIGMDAYDTIAAGRAADISFNSVAAQLLGRDADGDMQDPLHAVLAGGIVAFGWEAVGAMQAALEMTIGYTQQRKQFGQSLAQFQVVQHRLAEMAVQCAEAQACCELAAMRMEAEPGAAVSMAALVKSKVGRAARFVAQEAVQLHGAMGVCEELPIAATFRALLAFSQQHGDAAAHAAGLGGSSMQTGEYARSQTLREAVSHCMELVA